MKYMNIGAIQTPNYKLQESKMFDGKGMHKVETHYKVYWLI